MQHESALRPFDANAHNSFYLVVTFFFFIFYFIYEFFVPFSLLLLLLLHHFIFLLQNVLLPGCNCKFIITISYLRAISLPLNQHLQQHTQNNSSVAILLLIYGIYQLNDVSTNNLTCLFF